MLYESLRKREWFRLRGRFDSLGLCLGERRRFLCMMTPQKHRFSPARHRTGGGLGETPDTYFASGLMGSGAVLFPQEGAAAGSCDAVW